MYIRKVVASSSIKNHWDVLEITRVNPVIVLSLVAKEEIVNQSAQWNISGQNIGSIHAVDWVLFRYLFNIRNSYFGTFIFQ